MIRVDRLWLVSARLRPTSARLQLISVRQARQIVEDYLLLPIWKGGNLCCPMEEI